MSALANTERPAKTASRVHGTRKVLEELHRLKTKAERAALQRARTDAERAWLVQVVDLVGQLIGIGSRLPLPMDPRSWKRARKTWRPRDLFESSSITGE